MTTTAQLPKVTYTLKEVCAWSKDSECEHSYVEVVSIVPGDVPGVPGAVRITTLELPTTEALHLCMSMGSRINYEQLHSVFPSGWISPNGGMSLPATAQLLAQTISDKRGDLSRLTGNLRSISILIDGRTGAFKLMDAYLDEACAQVLELLDISPEMTRAAVQSQINEYRRGG